MNIYCVFGYQSFIYRCFFKDDWKRTAIKVLNIFFCIRTNVFFTGHKICKICPKVLPIRALLTILVIIGRFVMFFFTFNWMCVFFNVCKWNYRNVLLFEHDQHFGPCSYWLLLSVGFSFFIIFASIIFYLFYKWMRLFQFYCLLACCG